MATQKPLWQMTNDIVEHYQSYVDTLEMNRRLWEISEGQIFKEIDKSLRAEIISDSAYRRARERVPSINIIRQEVDKLSKVYIEPPIRRAQNPTDIDIMKTMVRNGNFDNCMMVANMYLNMHGMYAIEPFVQDGRQQLRVLGGHQFLPFSDDPSNPLNMTVFIKILGNEIQHIPQKFDKSGVKINNNDEVRQVTLLALYSDEEFMIIDTGGAIRRDKMREMGIPISSNQNSFRHQFGQIPVQYGNRSKTRLVPFPNKEGLDMSILIPKLFSDMNYAAQYMSHSIIWVKNSDLSNQEINPDAVVNLGERTEENGDPEMGVITPTVDIQNVLQLIKSQLGMYLSSRGIKTNMASSNSSDPESGVSKAIDEADTTGVRKKQVEFFRNAELELWVLMDSMQSVWVESNILTEENRLFSDTFKDTFTIMFAEMKPLKTMRQKIEESQLLRENKIVSRKRQLKMIFPELNESDIDEMIEEVDEENQMAFEQMMARGASPMAGRNSNGQFQEGNEESVDQEPSQNLQSRE